MSVLFEHRIGKIKIELLHNGTVYLIVFNEGEAHSWGELDREQLEAMAQTLKNISARIDHLLEQETTDHA